jgi:hypothetical protein
MYYIWYYDRDAAYTTNARISVCAMANNLTLIFVKNLDNT